MAYTPASVALPPVGQASLSLSFACCAQIINLFILFCPEPARDTRSLRLGGAYRLTDEGLAPLLRRAPGLEALSLPQCSRLDGTFLAALPASLRQASLGPSAWMCCIPAAKQQPGHVSESLCRSRIQAAGLANAARHSVHHECELELCYCTSSWGGLRSPRLRRSLDLAKVPWCGSGNPGGYARCPVWWTVH